MSKLHPVRRLASLFTALLVALSVLAFIPTPAGAVQTPETVVVNPDPADWTPDVLDGQVNAILQMGTKVVVGGTFTQVRRAGFSADLHPQLPLRVRHGHRSDRPQLRAHPERRGRRLTPGPDGTSVFVGGDFSTVNGQSYKKLVRLNLSNGSIVTSFKANTNGLVQDLVARDGLALRFGEVHARSRAHPARASPGSTRPQATSTPTSTCRSPTRSEESLGVPEIDVSPDGTKLVAIGSFSQVAGSVADPDRDARPVDDACDRFAVADERSSPVYAPNGTTTTWCASAFSTYMRDVDISPDGSYFVVVTTGAFRANRLCDSVTRWDLTATGPNQQPDLDRLHGGRHLRGASA